VRVLVTSDTHVGAARRPSLPVALLEHAQSADAILHAGDLTDPEILLELGAYAPVSAIRGNCDPLVPGLPERRIVELAGTAIGMVHDPGPESGRRALLRSWFPHCRVVVFGHTHLPVCEDEKGLLLLNPGSPTERRRAPFRSLALLDLEQDGRVLAELVPLPDLGARG
jgi:putative phosphoesterase